MGNHGAAAAAVPQTNAFSSMADSVEKTPVATPVAPAPVVSASDADTNVAGSYDDAGDVDFGDGDAMA
jgi:hypothetical protein